MLLSINQRKVQEQLRDNPLAYVVTPCNVVEALSPAPQIPTSYATTDIAFDVSSEAKLYRDRVLSIRRMIAEKGVHVATSPEEFEQIADETRGRR